MKIAKPFWIALGFIFMAIGAVGVPLPLLPTTPFLLLAAFCFAKGSRRLDAWFKGTKLYKNHLESFVQSRAMTLKTKLCILIPVSVMLIFAFIGMSHKDTTGTRIGRATVVALLILKYVYFFTRIKTISAEEARILNAEKAKECHTDSILLTQNQ
ncbi:MAG: YbaN family protein [Treponema sp.]|nr:YbaN family protein [Treponema sp.]